MRDYAKVSPAFWMTGSGRALRGHPEAQIVGLYLVTCPSANMIGLYYLPMALLVHETGLSPEGASKGLARASEAGFAFYDETAELVWVPNGANYQIGETLSGKDKRKEGVLRELNVFRKHPFAREFFDKYQVPYGLSEPDWLPAREGSPFEAPSKPGSGSGSGSGASPGAGEGAPVVDAPDESPTETDPEPMPRPAEGPIPDGVFNVERGFWMAAYERAVVAARGGTYIFPRKAIGALRSVVEACCKGADRRNIEAWVERDVGEFVRAVDSLPDDPSKRWSSYGPDGLLKWHNDTRPGYAPPAPPRAAPGLARAEVPAEPPVSAEEGRQRAAAVSAMLQNFGRGGAPLGR